MLASLIRLEKLTDKLGEDDADTRLHTRKEDKIDHWKFYGLLQPDRAT